ncbi:hypothetical protein A9168_08245 [Macellibacteroides sp. HH-ZS]|nr:hypothetical protein A9168_08245 [Macellibacteroides sp. HH-ZS]
MYDNYSESREKAIAWINSRNRDFTEGLAILQDSKFKPVAVSKVARWGEANKFAKDKLLTLIYEYIGKWIRPEDPKHNDEDPDETVAAFEFPTKLAEQVKAMCDEQGYPVIIRHVVHAFYALHRKRAAMHEQAAALEGNTPEVVLERQNLLSGVEAISARLDELWKAKTLYEVDGTVPGADLFEVLPEGEESLITSVETLKEATEKTPESTDYIIPDEADLEALKKLKKNTTSKLVKAKNMLDFQKESKQPELAPMPDGPKRAKQEKRVMQLTEFIEKIEYRIVELS